MTKSGFLIAKAPGELGSDSNGITQNLTYGIVTQRTADNTITNNIVNANTLNRRGNFDLEVGLTCARDGH